jgi:hypothetical protein
MNLFTVRFIDQSSGGFTVDRLVFKHRARQGLEAATVQGQHLDGA